MVAVDINSKYDAWAWIYNQYWGLEYCQSNLPPFEKLLQKYDISSQGNILDLCCGTGHMAQHLIEQGYQVTGIDISEAMLKYARENAPNAQFLCDDVRSFDLPSTFDAVISPSGSLNHMMSIEELKQVFIKAYNSLVDNGIFLFGLNLEDGCASWNGLSDGDVQDNYAWACCDSYDPKSQIGEFKITIFQLINQRWERLDIINVVKPYSPTEILATLENVGFTQTNVYDSEGNLSDCQCQNFAIFSGRK